MASSTAIAAADIRRQSIAPWWHTVLVLAPIAIGSVASAYQHGLPNANLPGVSHRLSSYFTVLIEEWFGVFLVWLALRRRRLTLGSLVSGHWQTPRAFFRDLGLAVGFMIVVVPLVGGVAYLLGANTNSAVANIPPKAAFELVVFLALRVSEKSLSSVDISANNSARGLAAEQWLSFCRESSLVSPTDFTERPCLPSCCKDGCLDCLPTGARAYAPECWPTACKIASAGSSHSSHETGLGKTRNGSACWRNPLSGRG